MTLNILGFSTTDHTYCYKPAEVEDC